MTTMTEGRPNEDAVADGEIAAIADSGWFDADWYIDSYPGTASDAASALRHFVREGWREGRDPGPRFSVSWYLQAYPDVATAELNPLLHFLNYGEREGRHAHPDSLTVTPATGHELGDGLNARQRDDIAQVAAHPLFDAVWYVQRSPDFVASGLSPAAHFVLHGGYAGRSPGPDFDLLAYLDARGDVEMAGVNAFVHYIRHGERERAEP